MIDGDAGTRQLSGEPAFAVPRYADDVRPAVALQRASQLRDDPFGAAGAVRFDQMGDAEAGCGESRRVRHGSRARWREGVGSPNADVDVIEPVVICLALPCAD